MYKMFRISQNIKVLFAKNQKKTTETKQNVRQTKYVKITGKSTVDALSVGPQRMDFVKSRFSFWRKSYPATFLIPRVWSL